MENKLSREEIEEKDQRSGEKLAGVNTRTIIRTTRMPLFHFRKSLTQQLPDVYDIQEEFPQSERKASPNKPLDLAYNPLLGHLPPLKKL